MTTDIRAESAALLAEALHASCETEWAIKATRGVTEMTLHFPDAHHDRAEAILAASPILARRLAFATAWEMAEAALPTWRRGPALYPWRDEWWAHAYDLRTDTDAHAQDISAASDDPTDALLALAAKLREATR